VLNCEMVLQVQGITCESIRRNYKTDLIELSISILRLSVSRSCGVRLLIRLSFLASTESVLTPVNNMNMHDLNFE